MYLPATIPEVDMTVVVSTEPIDEPAEDPAELSFKNTATSMYMYQEYNSTNPSPATRTTVDNMRNQIRDADIRLNQSHKKPIRTVE